MTPECYTFSVFLKTFVHDCYHKIRKNPCNGPCHALLLNFNTYLYCSDLTNYSRLKNTTEHHYYGGVEMFNGILVALGGEYTSNMEMYSYDNWQSQITIGSILFNPASYGSIYAWHSFSMLVLRDNINDIMFVFGMFTIFHDFSEKCYSLYNLQEVCMVFVRPQQMTFGCTMAINGPVERQCRNRDLDILRQQ